MAVQHDCVRYWLVCGTVYGDLHYKYPLGSITREEYCIPVPDFYQVQHDLRCLKSTLMD